MNCLAWISLFFGLYLMCSHERETILGLFFLTPAHAGIKNVSRPGSLKKCMQPDLAKLNKYGEFGEGT